MIRNPLACGPGDSLFPIGLEVGDTPRVIDANAPCLYWTSHVWNGEDWSLNLNRKRGYTGGVQLLCYACGEEYLLPFADVPKVIGLRQAIDDALAECENTPPVPWPDHLSVS